MATSTQIKALLSSFSTGDNERIRTVALQVSHDLPKISNHALITALTERRLHLNPL